MIIYALIESIKHACVQKKLPYVSVDIYIKGEMEVCKYVTQTSQKIFLTFITAPVVDFTQAYLDLCLGINSLYQGTRMH